MEIDVSLIRSIIQGVSIGAYLQLRLLRSLSISLSSPGNLLGADPANSLEALSQDWMGVVIARVQPVCVHGR